MESVRVKTAVIDKGHSNSGFTDAERRHLKKRLERTSWREPNFHLNPLHTKLLDYTNIHGTMGGLCFFV